MGILSCWALSPSLLTTDGVISQAGLLKGPSFYSLWGLSPEPAEIIKVGNAPYMQAMKTQLCGNNLDSCFSRFIHLGCEKLQFICEIPNGGIPQQPQSCQMICGNHMLQYIQQMIMQNTVKQSVSAGCNFFLNWENTKFSQSGNK